MEIQPASIAQVRKGRDGRQVLIENDVLDVARRIKEIDESLILRYNEFGEYFVVAQIIGDEEKLVLTAQELDERVLHRIKHITHASYNFADEAEKMDKQAKKDEEHAFHERAGEAGEVAAHALRKDIGATTKAFVPKDLDGRPA